MRILAVGDIVGEIGLKKAAELLPGIKEKYKIDFIIANGENSAEGMGITEKLFKEMKRIGINVITMGNHTWGKKDIFNIIDEPELIRPANYPKGIVGKGYNIFTCNNKKICVINLIGRVDINILSENPFLEADNIINEVKNEADIIIIDFHAEATAEKICFSKFLANEFNTDEKALIKGFFGTHTHVQTADEKIIKGMAYITDAGFCGAYDSVIGMEYSTSLKRLSTSLPERYEIAESNLAQINGVEVLIDRTKATSIKRINILVDNNEQERKADLDSGGIKG